MLSATRNSVLTSELARLASGCAIAVCATITVAAATQGGPVTISEDQKLDVATPMPYAYAGRATSIEGETLVLGAPGEGSGGAAHVYARTGTVWNEQATLTPSQATDDFGNALQLRGDTLIVGAYVDSTTSNWCGAAIVFRRTNAIWSEEAKLLAAVPTVEDRLGYSVAIDGDTAVAGAPFYDGAAVDSGAVFVFRRTGTTWSQEAVLLASDAGTTDVLGWSVDIEGDTVVAGALNASSGALRPGAVYVFTRTGGIWSQSAKLSPVGGVDGFKFGHGVALSGNRMLIGAPEQTLHAVGYAFVFEGAGASWAQTAVLSASDPEPIALLGASVALRGGRAVIGRSSTTATGGAYMFELSGSTWIERAKLVGTDTGSGDILGSAVGLSADSIVVGAWADTGTFPAQGSAYVYEVPPVATVYCTAKLNSQGCTPAISFSGIPSASAAVPFEIVASNVINNRNGLLFYGHMAHVAPFQGGFLCVQAPIVRTAMQSSGGNPPPADCSGSYAFDFNVQVQSGLDPALVSGSPAFCQYWSRDPSSPSTTGLTDAVRFFVCP